MIESVTPSLLGFDPVLAWLTISALVSFAVLVLVMMLWRRVARIAGGDLRLDTISTQITTALATSELIDQRLGRLHSQLANDNSQLREQVGTRLDAFKLALSATMAEDRAHFVRELSAQREQLTADLAEHRTRVEPY